MDKNIPHRPVLLTGSVPLPDAATVMTVASEILGARLKRIPDGETGARSKFITFQAPILGAAPQFVTGLLGPQSEWGPNGELPPKIIQLKPGASGTPTYGPLGYAAAAIESYATFARLKGSGKIGADARFQVGLPTPMGVIATFMPEDAQRIAEPPYESRMLAEIDEICRVVPQSELAIQWDIPTEVAVWEGCATAYFPDARHGMVERLVRLMRRAPQGVEQGLHVCYGDISHKHFKEPDAGVVAALVKAVVAAYGRPLDYVHLPVPHHWTDAEFFAPLTGLVPACAREIYLGLVHRTDGIAGAKKRMAAASEHLPAFGVGAACGLGRRSPAIIGELLRLHGEVADLCRDRT